MSRLVRLEPPYTRSAGREDALPLLRGPRLIRTREMGRWHRPRSGVQFTASAPLGARPCFALWCGQHAQGIGLVTATEVPDGEPLCGSCEGRAIGAGHPPIGVELLAALLFEPASSRPAPPVCPATRPRAYADDRWMSRQRGVFPCPACGEPTRLRAAGGPYDRHVKIQGHQTGPDLIDPCPFHRWDSTVVRADGTAGCSCNYGRVAA